MTNKEARKLFLAALENRLSGDQLGQFEAALADDQTLCGEFERFSDAQAGEVANIHDWLVGGGEASRRAATPVDSRIAAELISRVSGRRQRARMFQLAGAAIGLAAAAAVVVMVMLPANPPPVTPNGAGDTASAIADLGTGGKAILADGSRFATGPVRVSSAQGIVIELGANSLYRTAAGSGRLVLMDGSVRVKLPAECLMEVGVGSAIVSSTGPSEFSVTAQASSQPDPYEETVVSYDSLHRPRRLAKLGAAGMTLSLSVVSGNASMRVAGKEQVFKAGASYGPQVIQAAPQPPKPAKPAQPPKAEDVFGHLDTNSDGKLDEDEFGDPGHTDFDDDKNGSVDLVEFKAHFKPPQPRKPEDEFARLDKNKDGALDANEVDQRMLDDLDENADASISLEEFRARVRQPRPPVRPEDEFKRLDKNDDGKLDAQEADKKMLQDFDDNSDGEVSREEFVGHFQPAAQPDGQPHLEDEFRRRDRNDDGKLDAEECEQRMLDDLDGNKDGMIDLDEWREGHKPEKVFKRLDKNSDGKLDGDEADARMLENLDKNNDGSIDLDEFKLPPARNGGPQPPRGPGPRGPGGPGGGPGGPGGPGGGPRGPAPK